MATNRKTHHFVGPTLKKRQGSHVVVQVGTFEGSYDTHSSISHSANPILHDQVPVDLVLLPLQLLPRTPQFFVCGLVVLGMRWMP